MTNQNEADLQTINVSIEQAQKDVDKRESLYRLMKNRDFKALFMKGFFEEEAIRLVELKSHPAQQGELEQLIIDNQIRSIGMLKQFMNTIRVKGDMSERAIADHEQMREHIENGGLIHE